MPKKGRKKGEFKKQQARHKRMQKRFDKIAALRRGESVTMFLRNFHGVRHKYKIVPFDSEENSIPLSGHLLAIKHKQILMLNCNKQDGKYHAHNDQFYYENEIEIIGNVAAKLADKEKHV